MLVGNKCDVEERDVSTEEGQAKAKEFECEFLESSAKENININEIFTTIVKKVKEAQAKSGAPAKKKKSCGGK